MTLPFNVLVEGKPTRFPEKIWAAAINHKLVADTKEGCERLAYNYVYNRKDICFEMIPLVEPKLHTVRRDKKDRWAKGKKIHPVIYNRTQARYQFCPDFLCTGEQKILMTYSHGDVIEISIDGRELFGHLEKLNFAVNDGFDNWKAFFDYWYPQIVLSQEKYYKGKLIHYTDLRY